jgi:hypothetical protein
METETRNPRGKVNWPDWKKGKIGMRVRSVRTGWMGTVTFIDPKHHVKVRWDLSESIGAVVAPAFDLEVVQ